MNRYNCVRCGENWFSAAIVINCPRCGGEMVYAGPAGAGDDEKEGGKALVEEMAAYAAKPEVPSGGEDDKVICPLLTIAYNAGLASGSEESESDDYCKKEKCAWWGYLDARCAVLSLVRLAEAIAYIAYDKTK